MPASAAKVVQMSSGEQTWGATGVAVTKLHGITDATLRILDNVETVPSVGWYGPSPIALQVSQSGEFSMDMVATYEEMPRFLNGMFGSIGASTDGQAGGTSAPFRYYYEAPVSSPSTSFTYTFEYGAGGSTHVYRAPGSVIKHLNIKGEAGGLWNMTVDGFSQMIVASTSGFSTGASAALRDDRTVNPIRMADTVLYLDISTGTIGGTTKAATLISFELDVESNRHPKLFAGQVYPGDWGDAAYTGSLKTTLEFNANAKALVNQLLSTAGTVANTTAQTVKKLIRIGNLQSTGTSTGAAARAINLDFSGVLVDGAELFGDRDGNMTVDLTFNGYYSTGLSLSVLSTAMTANGNWLCATIQNGSSSTT